MDRWRLSQVCAISILILSTRISSMPNPLLVINFKMVKDKHNVILILVSPKILIPYSWGSSNSCFHLFILLHRSAKFSLYLVAEIHLNHYKVSPCVFNFFFLPLDHLFVTGVLHGGSTWWFIKDLFPSRSFHRDSFKEFKHSSSCIPECNSLYRIIGGGIMSFLIIWVHVPWFTCC